MTSRFPEILRFREDIVHPQIVQKYMKGFSTTTKLSSFIYFITDGEFVKIGIAYWPAERLKTLQIGNARELRILFTIPIYRARANSDCYRSSHDYASDIELFLHKGFGGNHIRGEWFDILDRINVNEWIDAFGCETRHAALIKEAI